MTTPSGDATVDAAQPQPSGAREFSYVPGLDGLRAIAVAAVLLYHGGVFWATGGFLGVEAFFVLSGFLITSLLLSEWLRDSTIKLRAFWVRRARCLLPALVCVVAAVGVYQKLAGFSHAVPGLWGDGVATLLYFGNWHEILNSGNYFVQSGPISPLQHTWSLAIEEQFYLVWPLLLLGVLLLGGRRSGGALTSRRRLLGGLAIASLLCAVASATEMALLFDPANSGRVYYGTDTRAQALLVGASLAFATAYFRESSYPRLELLTSRFGGRIVNVLGVLGLAVLLVSIYRATGESTILYHYGLFGIDLAVVAIIGAAVTSTTLIARLLSLAPLRALGIISYGVYLWHFPVFLWLTPSATSASEYGLLVLRLTTVLAVATVSYFVVEQPIRRRRVGRKLLAPLVPSAAALSVGALLLGAQAGAITLSTTVAPPKPVDAPKPTHVAKGVVPQSWYGNDPKCSILLRDTPQYFEASPPPGRYTADLMTGVASHNTDLGDNARATFRTCPPKRVLFIGDSIAFTLGFGMLAGEQRFGVELAGDPREACSFNTTGLEFVNGQYVPVLKSCQTELAHWLDDERRFHADAVVVELGWRDEFEWQVNGKDIGLGDPQFDAVVWKAIVKMVQTLGHGHVPILFLTVPWAAGVAEPDGSPAPQGTPQRHQMMNNLLAEAARSQPGEVRVLDIDRLISPGNRYQEYVDGQLCRFDGLHFTEFCAEVLQPYVLGEVRQMIADGAN